MTRPMLNINHTIRRLSLENMAAWSVAVCFLLLASWELSSLVATFFHIPWSLFGKGFILAGLIIIFPFFWAASRLSVTYCEEVQKNSNIIYIPNIRIIFVLVIGAILVLTSSDYYFKFGLALTSLFVIWRLADKFPATYTKSISAERSCQHSKFIELATFFGLLLAAVIVTLATHRPDLDDSHFIHMASQTLLHPDQPPLTFDTSLGFVLEKFRFAPYRVTSYETAVALISQFSGLNLLTVYYLLVPGLTSALTVCVAYLFARWFLPSGMAILATAIFLLLMLTWGESHYAYGNRVFVRLFQGKALLITLTTPITILAGLMLLRRPSWANAIPLAIAHVVAIGVSSSGLVLTVFISMLIMVVGIQKDGRKIIFAYGLISFSLILPAILVFWLKFQNESGIPFSEMGTFLPINSSLGLGVRESIALIAMIIGFAIFGMVGPKKEYGLIVLGVFLIILNPWLTGLITSISSNNMSWRLAWAAPVPLLISIGLASAISFLPQSGFTLQRIPATILSLIGLGLLLLFITNGRWALSPANNVKWSIPDAKLPPEYYSTKEIANAITGLNLNGTILANRDIAAWLPFAAPNLKLVMPGHTFHYMLQTVLPVSEYNARMQLYNAVNSEKPNLSDLSHLFIQFQVAAIITPQSVSAEDVFPTHGFAANFSIKEAITIAGYKIFVVNNMVKQSIPNQR
jgi:hypothetical protein